MEAAEFVCVYSSGKLYSLLDAYSSAPHVAFMNAASEKKMAAFLREWGPLYIPVEQRERDVVRLPVAVHMAYRDWLAALVEMTRLLRGGEKLVGAVRQFLRLAVEGGDGTMLRTLLRFVGDAFEWVDGLNPEQLSNVAATLLETYLTAPQGTVEVIERGGKRSLQAGFRFLDLRAALLWMIWQDVYRDDPLYCCHGCGVFFKGKSKHARKYCEGNGCAERVTSRNWMQKDRDKKKQLAQAKGAANGT
jgi:hypothetical protein